MKKRILGIVLCLIMALSLLPLAGLTAFAYSEGDIPGTTGWGTESDPILCDTLEEFKAAMENTNITYVIVDSFTAVLRDPVISNNSEISAINPRGDKVVTLNGDAVIRQPINGDYQIYDSLIQLLTGNLTIRGYGSLTFEPMFATGLGYGSNATIRVNGGTLNVESGNIKSIPQTIEKWGVAIYAQTGTLNISGGTFEGKTTFKDEVPGHSVAVDCRGGCSINISGGEFKASNSNGLEKFSPIGLDLNKNGKANITGGKFYGGISWDSDAVLNAFINEAHGGYEVYKNGVDLSLSSTANNCVGGDIIVKRKGITNVALEVSNPVKGKAPANMTFSAMGDEKFELIGGASWWYSGADALPMNSIANTTSFLAGSSYSAIYQLKAPEGEAFSDSDALRVNVSGGEKVSVYRASDTEIQVTVNFPTIVGDATTIDFATIYVDAPIVGKTPNDMGVTTSVGTIGGVWWSEGLNGSSTMNKTKQFEADKDYSAIYLIKAPAGRGFSSSLAVDVVGGEIYDIELDTNINYNLYITVNFPSKDASSIINSLKLTVQAPIVGKTPNDLIANPSIGFIGGVWWSEGLNGSSTMNKTKQFEADKDYSVIYRIEAPEGREFSSSLAVDVVGGEICDVDLITNNKVLITVNFYRKPSTVLSGDVNGDMSVNAADLTALLRHVAKIELLNDTSRADINKDGNIDAADVTALAKKIQG